MRWVWEQPDWPDFKWDRAAMAAVEQKFLLGAGSSIGTVTHLGDSDQIKIAVESMSSEALTTSEIEGDILDRASVQSSIQKQLGLAVDKRRVKPAESGIAEMMVDLFRTFSQPASKEMLFGWHRMVTLGRTDLKDIGRFRTSREPMQVVSGRIGRPKVHFEAPPAGQVAVEMKRFVAWFNRTAPAKKEALPAVTRAGLAHLYFETVHPFEDGNGRIGRAIAEKAMAQSVGRPLLVSLAATILAHRSAYYQELELANKKLDATRWLAWFGKIALEAQQRTASRIEFTVAKTKFLARLRDQVNERQMKALVRMLREGPDGFEGGMSAGNYGTITGASTATTTRDLADLVEKGAFVRTGERKHARYSLNL